MVGWKVENKKSNNFCWEHIALETSKHGDPEISSCLISTAKKETPAGNFVFFLSKESVGVFFGIFQGSKE